MPRSVASRLFLSYLAVVAVGLLAAALAIGGLLLNYEDQVIRVRLEELSAPLLTSVQNGIRDGKPPREIVDGLADQIHAVNARVLILGTVQRRVIVDSEGTMLNFSLPRPDTNNIGAFRDQGVPWIFVQQSLRQPAIGVSGASTVVVARPRASFADTLRALLPALVIAGLVAAGFALVVAGLLSRTITQPLRDLVRGARRFATGEYEARVPVGGPSEVAELGGAFNEMAGEIQRARGSEHAFLADISHELRTPLTSIQGFSQAIVDGEAQGAAGHRAALVIHREARRLVRMVEGLLRVAKLEAGARTIAREEVAPAHLIAGACAALDVQARDAGVRFDVDTNGVAKLLGDPDTLAQLFLNVLDNAVKHSPRGSTITIRAAGEDGHVVVRVRDEGSGLPEGAEARLFERFYRGENAVSRDGAGLGLAIAQAIARSHGGDITARNVAGGGAEFSIRLPA